MHRGLLRPDEVTTVGTIGVTTRARTAYDLARFAPSLVEAVVAVDALAVHDPSRSGREHPRRAASVTDRRLLSPGGPFLPADLLFLRNRHLGARNSRRLPEVVALADPLAESPMETRTRLALVLNGLPPPVSQLAVHDTRHCHYLDLGYPEYRVGIEYDGGDHLTPERARRDLERQHRLTAIGWTLVRPRAVTVLHQPRLAAVQVWRELDRAAERLGLPKITSGASPGSVGDHTLRRHVAGIRQPQHDGRGDQPSGGVQGLVRCMPAARPLPEITSAILRDASSIISSPIIAAPRFPPASEV